MVENQITTLQTDVSEIKSDVKGLVLAQQQLALAIAVKDAAQVQNEKSRAQNGVWARWAIPVLVTLVNVALAFIAVVGDLVSSGAK